MTETLPHVSGGGPSSPDLVLVGARVRPVSTVDSPADAIWLRNGLIAAVGAADTLVGAAGPSAQVADLGGSVVLPGFIDSHAHLENGDNYDHSMDGASSATEVLDRLVTVLGENTDDVVLCHGLGPCPLPDREAIDSVEPVRPVVIGIGAGALVANSAALRLSEERHGTEFVDRQVVADGHPGPSGRFAGRDAKAFLRSLTGYDETYVERALLRGADELRSAGITSVHHVVRDPIPVRVWQSLHAAGRLPFRVGLLIRGFESKIALDAVISTGLRQGFGDDWLGLQGVKISIDAHFPGGGAAFTQPYADEPDNVGSCRASQEELDDFIGSAHRAGLRCCVHANGDRAIDMALDSFEAALRENPVSDHRHRIEHAGNIYLRDDQIQRLVSLGLVAVPNPPFLRARGKHVLRRLGPERARHPMRVRDLIESGAHVVAASDFPGLWPADPLLSIQTLVTREDAEHNVWGGEQAISVAQAVALYTQAAAWGAFEEAKKGTIEAGKLADLVVLGADPYDVPAQEIGTVPVLATIIGGTVRSGTLPGA